MTSITLTHALGGHKAGDTIDVTPGVAEQLEAQGYTTDSADDEVVAVVITDDTKPPLSGKGSGLEAWKLYAESNSITVPADATRDDIVTLVQENEND